MRISRFLRRTYNICRGIVGIHEYSRITLTFVRLICSSILSNGKKRKMASNRNRRDGRRRTGTRDSVDWPGKWCRVASGKRRVIRSRRVGMSPSCVPAAGRHQRQPRLAARGDRGVVNLHRCLSIIASSLSPVRPLLLQFLFQSPSSINSDNARSSLTKIFILLVSPRRISYVTRIYIYIYRHLITIITITPITSRLLCFQQRPPSGRGSLNWQHPISLRYVPQFTPLVRTSSLSLHPFHAARSTSPRTDIFITRNRSLTLSPSPTYIYIYILHTQRKGSPPPRSPARERLFLSK